ncbi:MAG: cellulose synthase catalytic subunit, partial [Candidatus Roizmanbacteria bacterium]|nr:cellulose synthase catalytic subunit [Candidatus Roizmanbacteria bacterium]
MQTKDKVLSAVVVVLNALYLPWLATHIEGVGGGLLFFAEALIASLSLLFIINHWSQFHVHHSRRPAYGSVDIFLPVVNEPITIFERTLKAATEVNYTSKTIYILDDGSREVIKKLAEKYGVVYLARSTHHHRKAGNLNFGIEHSHGDFILVLDADQVAKPNIITDVLGYFQEDVHIAIVTLRQNFDVPYNDFNHDTLFYEHMQAGKNEDNAAISCGSGVFYRRTALESINGFQTWNVVEDLYTSYVLHARGFYSVYINKSYTTGLAPLDLAGIYQQRGTWAVDTLRLFFRRSPLFFKGFTFRQRLHYVEIGWSYIVSAIAIPIVFILPIVT